MAPSWDELSPDQKNMFLLENLVQKQDQGTPIACRLCDKIFFDNNSLMNHYRGHYQPSSSNPNPRNSVLVNAHNHIANENLGSAKPATFVRRDPPFSTLVNNPVQLRGPASTHRNQPYQSMAGYHVPKPSVPGNPLTIGELFPGQRRQRAMENKGMGPFPSEMEGPLASETRPFIMLLEKPIEEITADVIDVDSDELDLRLEL